MNSNLSKLKNQIHNIITELRMPRKIKENLIKCENIINDKKKTKIEKLNNIMFILEEINNIKNMPVVLRTEIWNLISATELLENEKQ